MHPARLLLALAVAATIFAGCGGFPTEPSDFEFGRADVYVRDTAGQAVDGVAVRLETTGGAVAAPGGPTGSVGTPGYYFFIVSPGTYRVAITLPAGYVLESGQTVVEVVLPKDQARRVDFVLRKV